jgi:hypothetical protein
MGVFRRSRWATSGFPFEKKLEEASDGTKLNFHFNDDSLAPMWQSILNAQIIILQTYWYLFYKDRLAGGYAIEPYTQ